MLYLIFEAKKSSIARRRSRDRDCHYGCKEFAYIYSVSVEYPFRSVVQNFSLMFIRNFVYLKDLDPLWNRLMDIFLYFGSTCIPSILVFLFSFYVSHNTPSKNRCSAFREASSLQIIMVPGCHGIIAYFWKQFKNFRKEETAGGDMSGGELWLNSDLQYLAWLGTAAAAIFHGTNVTPLLTGASSLSSAR